uniref:p-glycoprotein n=2 Tax=Panagrolaimus sp. JU765 TaxID=591449 RepID=A0AC34QSI0_9BILA
MLVSIVTGVGFPLMSIVIGNISDAFIKMTIKQTNGTEYTFPNNNTTIPYSDYYSNDDFKHDVMKNVYFYLIIGTAVLTSGFVQVSCFLVTGENIIHRTRKAFLKAIMRQDIPWFDKHNSGTLTTKLFDNLERVQEGTGDKVGLLVQLLSQFFSGFIIAFTYDWKLTLIMLSVSPFLIIAGAFMARMMASSAAKEAQLYSKAGSIAEQALTSIRTVVAFNGQVYECDRYDAALKQGKNTGIVKSFYIGCGLAATFFIMFSSYCLAFWIGTNFIANGTMKAQTVLTVFFSIMMSSMALGQAGQQFAVIGTAQGAAAAIYEIIDRKPEIDCYAEDGEKPSDIRGEIRVENLEFSYPTRRDIKILDGVSFDVKPGQTIALVGSSGCGKSTIVQLLLRYYNLDNGSITIDGHNITNLNVKYLRQLIGVVSQEPILFNCTIEENIRYGNDKISQSQMIAACRMANADNFIQQLPNGYKTIVGERGTQLSGGQKQRIAIARALVRNPRILLLDEATSALDAESESIVQQALDKAREGRTTLVIAHRLSTIRNADKIVAMKGGKIIETGTHDELMAKKGLYHELVSAQVFADLEDEKPNLGRQTSVVSARSRSDSVSSVKQTARRLSVTIDGVEDVTPVQDEKSVLKRLKQDLEAEGATESNLFKIVKQSRPEWPFLIIATVASLIQGLVFPMFSIFFSEIITVFSTTDMAKLKRDGHFWALMFLVLGGVQGVCLLTQAVLFGYSSERLTMRLRSKLFRNIMRMDIAFFDMPQHSSGKLSTRLATDCPNVKSAIDFRLGSVFSAFVSVGCGIGIGLYYGWQLALLMIALFPVVAIGRSLQFRYLRGKADQNAKDSENAGNLALEAIENIRTVQALTLQDKFNQIFADYLQGPHETSTRKHLLQGVTYGFSSSIMFYMNAANFGFGLFLILHEILTPMHVLRVLFAISFTGGSVGFAAAYFPEYNKAKIAAGLIFKMLSEKPAFDNFSTEGRKTPIKGSVDFKNIQFTYPQRKEIKVLKGLDIDVQPGQTLALVGPSGCGKSTVISLLERFYDPSAGKVLVDGEELQNYNIQHIRGSMALVSQEPILFDCSIRENILYGLDPSSASHEEMMRAAEKANIAKFVSNLPSGFETRVGEKGTQLSGGQKQRIAIARALVRNPKILLLDEATSALDTESEKIVQEALDRAREGRTCIVIAHRLSTVVNADCIAVVKDGVVLEKGTHPELIEKRGFYYRLTLKQNIQKTPNS